MCVDPFTHCISQQIRQIKFIGIWPVAYAGFLHFEGPMCVNNSVVEWHALFAPERYVSPGMFVQCLHIYMYLI